MTAFSPTAGLAIAAIVSPQVHAWVELEEAEARVRTLCPDAHFESIVSEAPRLDGTGKRLRWMRAAGMLLAMGYAAPEAARVASAPGVELLLAYRHLLR